MKNEGKKVGICPYCKKKLTEDDFDYIQTKWLRWDIVLCGKCGKVLGVS
jgi:uncharacterized CHY-type Zn-finger protein